MSARARRRPNTAVKDALAAETRLEQLRRLVGPPSLGTGVPAGRLIADDLLEERQAALGDYWPGKVIELDRTNFPVPQELRDRAEFRALRSQWAVLRALGVRQSNYEGWSGWFQRLASTYALTAALVETFKNEPNGEPS